MHVLTKYAGGLSQFHVLIFVAAQGKQQDAEDDVALEDKKIDAMLWDRVQNLGLDPIQLLDGHFTNKQIRVG